MKTALANVIDLEAYRSERAAKRQVAEAARPDLPSPLPIAWVPVWFMPVVCMMGAPPASAAS